MTYIHINLSNINRKCVSSMMFCIICLLKLSKINKLRTICDFLEFSAGFVHRLFVGVLDPAMPEQNNYNFNNLPTKLFSSHVYFLILSPVFALSHS